MKIGKTDKNAMKKQRELNKINIKEKWKKRIEKLKKRGGRK